MSEPAHASPIPSGRAGIVVRQSRAILFFSLVLCIMGVYAAFRMPASVFPQTDFPRVVILLDNGAMPADAMMATITRPIEEAMKDIPGSVTIRSATGRGSAEVNVFFEWNTDMVEAELYALNRLAQIRGQLPPATEARVYRLTFSAFPIIGVSLTSDTRDISQLWETAEYEVKPRLLRMEGVARINLVGGRVPEYHVILDPAKLEAFRLSPKQVSDAIAQTNTYTPLGMHEENYQLYLALADGRVATADELKSLPIAWTSGAPVLLRDVATIERGHEPQYNVVTADGNDAVLLNIHSQPGGNTLGIAKDLKKELDLLKRDLPPDMRIGFYYDQSTFVLEGVRSVRDSIAFGLLLSSVVLFLFLRSARTTAIAVLAIPATLLMTLAGMYLTGMSFNLMTLGGIAAAIGLIIDDTIVVVESMYAKVSAGHAPREAVQLAIREVGPALVGSTLTPVVVFLPLAYLDGVPGVFFRALAMTMVLALLISLVVAVTLIPTLGAFIIRPSQRMPVDELEQGGAVLRRLIASYEWAVRGALRHAYIALMAVPLILALGAVLYLRLPSGFLPDQDEGAFVLDYVSRPGTSLSETDRMLRHVEEILRETPEIEGYSRRTGARLALAIAEPNTGDFLIKLRDDRSRSTSDVIDELRVKVQNAEPALETEFPGVLGDLIGDLTWSPEPIEIKIFSNDTDVLVDMATKIAERIEQIPGVVDVNDGLIVAGPALDLHVRTDAALRAGLTAADVDAALETSLLGNVSSVVQEGDRIVNVRVLVDPSASETEADINALPLRADSQTSVTVRDVVEARHEPGLLEMHREDQRQLVAVSALLSGRDLRSGIAAIKKDLSENLEIPPGVRIEYGGLYQQQQESFRNLTRVLITAVLLVFGVLVVEFRSILYPIAIVAGALLALVGVVGALWATGTSLNIVSFLSAIIGIGIVAKNGILMLDYVDRLRASGSSLVEALVQSGRRRLRPVLMTSLTTFLGLLPLAYGIGAGADMLRPLAIGVIGALCISLVLSLVATPLVFYLLAQWFAPDTKTEPQQP